MHGWIRKILTSVTLLMLGWGGSACEKSPPSPPLQQGLVAMANGLPNDERWRQDFAFADMDGDGRLDIVTAPPRKSKEPWPHIFLSRGDRWEPVSCPSVGQNGFPQQEYTYGGVAVADFGGDDQRDIAIAMHETGIRIFINKGEGPCGPWEEQQGLPQPMLRMRSRTLAAADLNHDGRMELIALAEAPDRNSDAQAAGVSIFWQDASGWRLQKITGSDGLFGDDLALGEINGDGIPDIAVGSLSDQRPQFVWLSDGKGDWQAASTEGFPPHIIAWSVQLADFDTDGKDELLLGVGGAPIYQNGGPRVYRWDGTRWHDDSQGLPQTSWVCGVTAVDLDGDGKKEIVSAGMYTGTVQVYSRRPDGTWEERHQLQVAMEQERLRNYKVRGFSDNINQAPLIVANYAGEGGGKMMAWTWR